MLDSLLYGLADSNKYFHNINKIQKQFGSHQGSKKSEYPGSK